MVFGHLNVDGSVSSSWKQASDYLLIKESSCDKFIRRNTFVPHPIFDTQLGKPLEFPK